MRCTFFGEWKNSCRSKFVQLLLLHWVKAKGSENHVAQGFHYINSFISNSFGPNSKTCTCEVRAAWGRVSRGLTVVHFGQNQKWGTTELQNRIWRRTELWQTLTFLPFHLLMALRKQMVCRFLVQVFLTCTKRGWDFGFISSLWIYCQPRNY